MHGEADARESGRLEWTLNDDDDDIEMTLGRKNKFTFFPHFANTI